jgi:hypothetical protein
MNTQKLALLVTLLFFSIEGFSQNSTKDYEGFFNFTYDEAKDKITLEVQKLDTEFLYVNSLATGIGSNDIGLDRGQLGNSRVVKFIKAGNKLLLVQPNQKFRANTTNAFERKSIEQAFAKSVLFGFKIESNTGETYKIDLTPFLMQDTHGVANRLKRGKEGNYSVDASKSALSLDRTKAFPKNVEFEALLTFKGQPTGPNLRNVTPTASLVTVTQHHSFVELPDGNYTPREFDVRSGAISMSYMDYATPVQEPITKRFVARHRLEKLNPTAAVSEAKEPIIYYLDPGTPEPVRSALLEGGSWWNQAYESIGFKNAFQMKMLPADADPMDVRYNLVQWVHRSTRGWSYGSSVSDPRTGEIIKGHVSLGSLRIRQDFLIAQALLNKPFAERDDNYQPMLEMALARIRQLSAHEIGHTIGFAHNFAASTSNRASVMDYPHPQVKLTNGQIDLSDAYATGIGDWDKVTVAYSYSQFPEGTNEKEALNGILENAYSKGMRFISDSDARAQGGAHALAHLWDNGKSAAQELNDVLEVRDHAITNFSKDNIRSNEPYSVLEDVFVPLYFFHRYQTEAAAKVVGGLNYNYAVKGDNQFTTRYISPKEQKEALKALLNTLKPETLAIPKEKLELFPPRAFGYRKTRESFKGKTGVAFDALSVASTSSDMTLKFLLHPERANRLIQQKALDENQLGLQEVLNTLISATLKDKKRKGYHQEIQNMVNYSVLNHIMAMAGSDKVLPQVTALTTFELMKLKTLLAKEHIDPISISMVKLIDGFIGNPKAYKAISYPKIPDGSPIGSDMCSYTDF